MKKQLSLFVLALAMVGVSPAVAYTNHGTRAGSSADLTGAPAERVRENVNYEKYKTRTYTKTYEQKDSSASDLYYVTPSQRSQMYKQYEGANSSLAGANKTTIRTTRTETTINKLNRKYYLAHPFFQPLEGKFGSITDIAYNNNSFDFKFASPAGEFWALDESSVAGVIDFQSMFAKGSFDHTGITVKEDFSYGITDQIAVLAMARFDIDDYEFKWDDGTADKDDETSLKVLGLGAQWRFVDNEKWIATASAYFQNQKDVANNFVLDLKGGYKVSTSTIYGLGRAWYVDFEDNAYGVGLDKPNGNFFLAYDDDASSATYFELGAGVFSVLNQDWTLNVEAVFGAYDWHNQASIKGAIGWQPNEWFALNLYAKTSFFDSADDKKVNMYYGGDGIYASQTDAELGENALTGLQHIGSAELSDYAEMTLGAQVIFYF